MGYQSNSRTELGAEGSFQQRHFQPRARDILLVGPERVNTGMEKLGTYN